MYYWILITLSCGEFITFFGLCFPQQSALCPSLRSALLDQRHSQGGVKPSSPPNGYCLQFDRGFRDKNPKTPHTKKINPFHP